MEVVGREAELSSLADYKTRAGARRKLVRHPATVGEANGTDVLTWDGKASANQRAAVRRCLDS
jgi:hypothetical protein